MRASTEGGPIIWPWSYPTTYDVGQAFIGRKIRFVQHDGVLTEDFVPGRITVFLTADQRVEDVKFEADTEV